MIKQMTLRCIPDSEAKALRKQAKERGRSLNKVSIELLSAALGIGPIETQKIDLNEFCGLWDKNELEEFNRNSEESNTIDPEIWV